MLNINSYKNVNSISFGMDQEDVFKALGQPDFKDTNSENEESFHYKKIIVRMDAIENTVREITLIEFVGEEFHLNSSLMKFDKSLPRKLFELDSEVYELYGCWVFFDLGITLTGYEDALDEKIITVFRKGDWDSLKGSMKPVGLT